MAEDKNFADGIWVYEMTFQNGGSVLNCSCDAGKFIEWLNRITDDKGQARFTISKRLNVVDKKPTHNVYENTYKRKGPESTPAPEPEHRHARQAPSPIADTGNDDNLPF